MKCWPPTEKVTNPIARGIGLTWRKALPLGGGLIIQPCNSVVSFFMRFSIDVLFVALDGTILHVLPNMVPWRTSRIVKGSKYVVELPAGTAKRTGTEIGHTLDIRPR